MFQVMPIFQIVSTERLPLLIKIVSGEKKYKKLSFECQSKLIPKYKIFIRYLPSGDFSFITE